MPVNKLRLNRFLSDDGKDSEEGRMKGFVKRLPPVETKDEDFDLEDKAENLITYAESDLDVFKKHEKPIIDKMSGSVASPSYDKDKFVEMWGDWAREAAKRCKEKTGESSFSDTVVERAAELKERTVRDELKLLEVLRKRNK